MEEQLPQSEASPRQQDDVLGGDSGINGVAESGLGHLGLVPGEQLTSTLNVFVDVHAEGARFNLVGTQAASPGYGWVPMDEKRIAELEIRYMHQQELLQELSGVLYEQQKVIDQLRAEVDRLKQKLEAEPGLVDARHDERPPHY
ncbi:hypothetical protein MVI01_65680 [Myxococcus virescens]|nr:hypothetical protein MVI01_65680 [Myxococcus virescens]